MIKKKYYIIFIIFNFIFSESGDIIITEIFYESTDLVYDYIEIYNNTSDVLSLDNWKIKIIQGEVLEHTISSASIFSNEYFTFVFKEEGAFFDQLGNLYLANNDLNGAGYPSPQILSESYYWVNTFHTGLSNGDVYFEATENATVTIEIFDNNNILVDQVIYSTSTNFPVGVDNIGYSIEFIIDPSNNSSVDLNNNSTYWKTSRMQNDLLYINFDANQIDYGSPNIANYLNLSIDIEPYLNSLQNPDSSNFSFIPAHDGYPGGTVDLELIASAVNSNNIITYLDQMYWTIYKESEEYNSCFKESNFVPSPSCFSSVQKNQTSLTENYNIQLFAWDINGVMGVADTLIYIDQEINIPPEVLTTSIYSFEDSSLIIYATDLVKDELLCETFCVESDQIIYEWQSEFGNSEDFFINFSTPSIIKDDNDLESINSSYNLYEFTLTVTDPFGAQASNIISVYIYNYNNKPEVSLDFDTINEIKLINGLSITFGTNESSIILYEMDASGLIADSYIIGSIVDIDGDNQFTVIPLINNCEAGYSNNICSDNYTVKTELSESYSGIEIPFVLSDNVPVPNGLELIVEDFNDYSNSAEHIININGVQILNHQIEFESFTSNDGIYYINEDTIDVFFNVQFYLGDDIDSPFIFNSENLYWFFESTDSVILGSKLEDANQDIKNFKIDSIQHNYNGNPNLYLCLADTSASELAIEDTMKIHIPIFINQRNDIPEEFQIKPELFAYDGIDNSSFYNNESNLFHFRLPQSVDNVTNDIYNNLIFQWNKNELIDVDLDPILNINPLKLYYRLELFNILSDTIFILQDSIQHINENDINTTVKAEIDVNNLFYWYDINSNYESYINNEPIYLEKNGYFTYQWRVVAQNYEDGILGTDPNRISNMVEKTNFKIDLIPPKVKKISLIKNSNFPGFYDIILYTNGLLAIDTTYINISGTHSNMNTVRNLNPREIGDSLYHITSYIDMKIDTTLITFEMILRDRARNNNMNSISIFYGVLDNLSRLMRSPTNIMEIFFQSASLNEKTNIIIKEETNISLLNKSEEIEKKITPMIEIYPYDLQLKKDAIISFNLKKHLNEYQKNNLSYSIIKLKEDSIIFLDTWIDNNKAKAKIKTLGKFYVIAISENNEINPQEFNLFPNYPNPFNPSTNIMFDIPTNSYINASIYNLLGQEIYMLLDGIEEPGKVSLTWNGEDSSGNKLSSGVYFLRVSYNNNNFYQKLLLLK